ncbi:MAG TPA: serine--tRNA ligase [Gemmatimonadaceae bacterium]|jgi:seryl-tRNA synthetase|nr:serine--tRNA ligase [Gemmatimonadaceae bacterium]
MHDLKSLRDQIDALRDAMRRREKADQIGPLIDQAETLDRERRMNIQAVEERKAARNAATQEVARRKKAKENADDVVAQSRALGEEISRLESELAKAESELERIMLEIPNIPLPEVPDGGEECNVIVREWGAPRMDPALRPHWEIAEALGILDLARGAKISGSGFVVFRRAGARLVRSLMNLFLDVHTGEHGYEELWVPTVVNRATMTGTAQLPKFEDDMYGLRDEDLFLIPTAEVPVTNLYRDEMLDGASLPRAFCAYTPCFRREAGSAGKDTRGVLRVHEFDKVELVRYATPETSASEHELMTKHATTLLERLGLPYRVKLLAAGDTGFASAKTYDLETYAPGVGTWLEVSSSSTFTDFQARRANIRYRPAPGEKPRFIHTLNASGLAFPRVIATIIEHYQQPDGSVTVPEALRPYLGADSIR